MLKPYLLKNKLEAGVDEVGRGCLAGPVVAAAVILPQDYKNERLNDSKKLNHKIRVELAEEIKNEALYYAIAEVDNIKIDEINILNASFLAMHIALKDLEKQPQHILVDGNKFKPYNEVAYTCVIKGDGKFASIAAASILAKVYRDDLMAHLDEKYPYFDWKSNKGYPTKKHREGIKKEGPSPFHRKSFKLLEDQLSLFE